MEMGIGLVIAYCGVCCNHCGMRARIPRMARELKRFIDAYGYCEWIHNIDSGFDFKGFLKGLEWFSGFGCLTCPKDGGMPGCEVRLCCSEKHLQNCYFCNRFIECAKLDYQKETYVIGDNYARISRIGYMNWLREEGEKARQGFDNISYLERKRSKGY